MISFFSPLMSWIMIVFYKPTQGFHMATEQLNSRTRKINQQGRAFILFKFVIGGKIVFSRWPRKRQNTLGTRLSQVPPLPASFLLSASQIQTRTQSLLLGKRSRKDFRKRAGKSPLNPINHSASKRRDRVRV